MSFLRTLSYDDFEDILGDLVRPARAVTKSQHLHGRAESLKRARRAIRSQGAQAFIYGERGVGKTSLAKTALAEVCPDHASDLLIACEKGSTFKALMSVATRRLLTICRSTARPGEIRAAFQASGFSSELVDAWEKTSSLESSDINDVISALKVVDRLLEGPVAVIIDEFDLISDHMEKDRFAEFVKQLSDQEVRVKFIFCGIANDVDSLIGAHFSSGRYLEPIELGPLKYGDIFAIFEDACNALEVKLDKEVKIRSALIADGYPYFMHLVAQNSLEILFDRKEEFAEITPVIFQEAVERSIERAEPMLKSIYDTATKKYLDDYQQVLWCVSAMTLFENRWDDIYERAYLNVVATSIKRDQMDRDRFYKRMLNLTHGDHGRILSTNKNGWYRFSENVVRSYSRLRASEAGIDLGIDMHGASGKFRSDEKSSSR